MSEAPVFRINLVRDPNNRNAQLYIQDVYELVEYEMEVSYEDVVGVQRRGLHSFDIMIKREEYAKYIDILNGFKDKKIELSNGKIVTVINPYERLKVYYPEQEQSCRKCDLRGHKWFNCKTPFRE